MTMLHELKNGSLKLYDENDALNSLKRFPRQSQLLRYVISQHDLLPYGILPNRQNILKNLIMSSSNFFERQNNLFKKGLLLRSTLMELLKEYCTLKGNKWYIPESLQPTISKDLEKFSGRKGNISSWKHRLENPFATYWPRYYTALVTREGVPVFIRIFTNLPYATTIQKI